MPNMLGTDGFPRRVLRLLRVVVVASPLVGWLGIVFILKHAGVLEGDIQSQYDVYLRTRDPRPFEHVVTVRIDDTTFNDSTIFAGNNPLNPEIVMRLLRIIERGEPAVIGVDLVTDSHLYEGLAKQSTVRYVWAVSGTSSSPPIVESFVRRPALLKGGTNLDAFGVALLPARSGVVRADQTRWSTPLGVMWSFGEAVVRAYRVRTSMTQAQDTGKTVQHGERIPIMFSSSTVPGYPAAVILQGESMPAFSPHKLFKDKIVLVGGTFNDAREERETPLGPAPGVDIWAQAVEARLARDFVQPKSSRTIIVLELVALAALLLLSKLTRQTRWSVAVLIGAVIILSIGLSLVVFNNIWTALTFLPVLSGAIVDLLWDMSVRQTRNPKPRDAVTTGRPQPESTQPS